jgi:hypothetical protein
MTSSPGTWGRGGAEFLEAAFAFLDPRSLDAVQQVLKLANEPHQLRARLAEGPVVLGEPPDLAKLLRRQRDVLRPALAAVAEHGAGVQFPPGTMAGGLSAAATERIEGAGQEGLAGEEGFEEGGELLLQIEDLGAEGTEGVGDGLAPGARAYL